MNRVCPICGDKNYKLIFKDHNRREGYTNIWSDFVECSKCEMKYLTNIPNFDDFFEKYEEIYIKPNIDILKSKLKENIKTNGKKILDIGCNFGQQLIKYYNNGYEVYGTDLNFKAINDCKKYLPKNNFYVSTVENLDFNNNYFDIIRTSHVLEHIYNLDSFLKSCNKLLKKGGKLEIIIPNGSSLEMKIWGKYSSQSWIPFHINMFNKKSIIKILKKNGFSEIYVKTNPIPWWWILSYRQYKGTINIKIGVTNFEQKIYHKLLQIIILPFLIIISLFGYGEELIIKGRKLG